LGESYQKPPHFGTAPPRNSRIHGKAHLQAVGHSFAIVKLVKSPDALFRNPRRRLVCAEEGFARAIWELHPAVDEGVGPGRSRTQCKEQPDAGDLELEII